MHFLFLLLAVLLPLLAAPIPYLIRKQKAGDIFVSGVCLAELILMILLAAGEPVSVSVPHVFYLGLSFSTGGIQTVFAVICGFMFFMSSLANPAYFRGEERTERYRAFLLLTLSGIQGVFLAGDLLTLYVFFETMSIASWVWVAHNETKPAQRAADTYLAMAMMGGLTMLYGLFVIHHRFGTLALNELHTLIVEGGRTQELLMPGICLLVGFGIKAGMFPFHVWLPKAHPVAPAPSSALLSGILTKSGIYGILLIIVCLLWGDPTFMTILLVLGTITMVLGALIAVFSLDLKRTLACSSLSQIGFILVGAAVLAIGQEGDLAAGGLMAHALNHSLTKLILFLIAGVLYAQRHTLDLNKLKGAGRGNLPLMLCFLIGGASLAGVPGLGGYVSKTLLHESIVHQIHLQSGSLSGMLQGVEQLFLFSGGLTAAYMTKLFVKIFVEKPEGDAPAVKADKLTLIAIVPAAIALLVMGIIPQFTYEKIGAFAADSLGCAPFAVSYFIWENLKGALISLGIGAAVYLLFVRGLLTDRKTRAYTRATTVLDLEDDVYRPVLHLGSFLGAMAARIGYSITDGVVWCVQKLLNLGAADRIRTGKDHHFTRYSRHYVRMDPIKQTLQFELLLFGLGVVCVLGYLLLRMYLS